MMFDREKAEHIPSVSLPGGADEEKRTLEEQVTQLQMALCELYERVSGGE